MPLRAPSPSALVLALAVLAAPTGPAALAAPGEDPRAAALAARAASGVLYDRVLPLARLDALDGTAATPVATTARFLQACDEWRRASRLAPAGAEALAALVRGARDAAPGDAIPLAFLDATYDRLADPATPAADAPLVRGRAFTFAALAPRSYRGGSVSFRVAPEAWLGSAPPVRLELDLDDGRGWRDAAPGATVHARYAAIGPRTLHARATRADGTVALARAAFEVAALATPAPDDTLAITATEPWNGTYGHGAAYVYRAPGHTTLVNPVVVVEGFDTDNSMHWDQLYALLDQQGLIETLRTDGFDCVVLDFADATDDVQRNGFVVAALIAQVRAQMPPGATMAVVGASMGGLCSRWALAWMEQHGVPHAVRTWISFDSPHGGADIPLGLQYWIDFFSSQSTSAADFRAVLQRPAARQMLLHHFTTPATTSALPDPLRAPMLADFAGIGNWPALPRLVAIANGASTGATQGFSAGAQLIRYEYSSLLASITGNVWAVPNATSTRIFQGSIRILFSTTSQNVTVSGSTPWDGAPGGWRGSMAQLDTTVAPYGDIVALHPAHGFIPTVSALALPTADPFFDVDGTPNLASLTPFDAVYVPTTNQEHVSITPENAAWVRNELWYGTLDAPVGVAPARATLADAAPNPARGSTTFAYTLPRAGRAELSVHDLLGRRVATLANGQRSAGRHEARWDGRDDGGRAVPAGVYFARLTTADGIVARRVLLLR